MFSPPSQNTVGVCNQITLIFLYYFSSSLVTHLNIIIAPVPVRESRLAESEIAHSDVSFQPSHCWDCPKWYSNPPSQQPAGQDLRLRLHGHWNWHKQDLRCLLKWVSAYIHFECDFCTPFQYNISVMAVRVGVIPSTLSAKHTGNHLLHIH